MKLTLDTSANTLVQEIGKKRRVLDLFSKDAFELISLQWIRIGWNQKYQYTFSWMGRPVIQLPEDMIRIQEVIYQLRPDAIVETGVAHGGSLIFYATLCNAMGKGRVIGIDIEIRKHNRTAIESHEFSRYITLVEGNSIDPQIVAKVESLVRPDEKILVVLDSNHTKAHVLAELNAYSKLISPGSYIVATDGIMKDLVGVPRSNPDWEWNNPRDAAEEFVQHNPNFVIEEPIIPFNEGNVSQRVTYWPFAFVRRKR